jgi:hypothetical protein
MLVENAFPAVPSTTAPGFSISSRARSFANGQIITELWNGSESQSGANVTATNLSYNGSNPTGRCAEDRQQRARSKGIRRIVLSSTQISPTTPKRFLKRNSKKELEAR